VSQNFKLVFVFVLFGVMLQSCSAIIFFNTTELISLPPVVRLTQKIFFSLDDVLDAGCVMTHAEN
jgi:hypothetical protein